MQADKHMQENSGIMMLASNVDRCHVLADVHSDEALGKFYVQPKAEAVKARKENGSARLNFKVNKWDILYDMGNNANELEKLGATYDGKGVNFAVFSENATKVELCLFESSD